MAITYPGAHLCVQGVLYLVIFLLGFPVAVPLLVTYVNFSNRCMFYAKFTGTEPIYYHGSASSNCTYPIGISVICLLYGLAMTVWYCKTIARREPDAGSQMPTLLPLLVNCVMSVAIFISSCIISVGFRTLCDRLEAALSNTISCVNGEQLDWNRTPGSHVNAKSYYSCFKVAEIASWTCFLVVAAQAALGMLRLYRNHRMSSPPATGMNNDASAEPTA